MTPLRVAILGCGQMARRHVDALGRVPVRHRIVAVHDPVPDAARALALATKAEPYERVDDLLRDAQADIVHICTPPATHVPLAHAALTAGAHVYIEKPFAETLVDARDLLELARTRDRLVCAGHQLLCDPVYERLMRHAPRLGRVTQVESTFLFQPPSLRPAISPAAALAEMLIDVLPHPLYLLLATLERVAGADAPDLVSVSAHPTDLHALIRVGDVVGRLWVSLSARPVASTLSLSGSGGTLRADFMRGSLGGVPNPGTTPIEKLGNAAVEGAALAWRGSFGLFLRLARGRDYPGLRQLLTRFYGAVRGRGPAPFSPMQLRRVAEVHEELATRVRASVQHPDSPRHRDAAGPVAVVTGAAGMLGRAIARSLAGRGYQVRGIGRSADPLDRNIHDWRRLDLSRDDLRPALADATVVIHAAAATSGGYDAHARDSIDATRRLLDAMVESGVTRLVHVSSLSVVRPPRSRGERQDERTPLAVDARALGPYTWGKCEAEDLLRRDAEALGVATRIVRPGALVAWNDPELPGLVGRRLFGAWHLGLGRPGLPIAIYPLHEAAQVIAWIATDFAAAPPVVHLIDETVPTRGVLIARLRAAGWQGRMLWVPIRPLTWALGAARVTLGLARGRLPEPLDAWAVLRPRWFDTTVATDVRRHAALPADAPAPVEAE